MALPGHLLAKGRESGEARTDSPTAGRVSLYTLLAMAAQFGWESNAFDVEAAFLTGKQMDREVYFRAPRRLPGVPPGSLARAINGALRRAGGATAVVPEDLGSYAAVWL